MYQYKAILKSTREVIAENHTIEDLEKDIKHFKRGQKHGEHTRENDLIEVFHVFRDGSKDKLIKTISGHEGI